MKHTCSLCGTETDTFTSICQSCQKTLHNDNPFALQKDMNDSGAGLGDEADVSHIIHDNNVGC